MTQPRDLRDPRAPVEPAPEPRDDNERTPITAALRRAARRCASAEADKMATPGAVRGYETK